jgi:hypothetical protein
MVRHQAAFPWLYHGYWAELEEPLLGELRKGYQNSGGPALLLCCAAAARAEGPPAAGRAPRWVLAGGIVLCCQAVCWRFEDHANEQAARNT